MPDGTHQIADRYIPQTGEPCPTLLVRTPYGRRFPYDFLYGGLFAEQGYHVLLQSTRGTGGSGGSYEPFIHEAADAQATIAWLREQPWFNGSLATIGASYLGFTQWALAHDVPPELKAMVVQVSTEDFYGFLYPGGAFAMEATLTGMAALLSQDKGLRAFTSAVLRLALTHKKVARTLPLVPGYKLAFGKRVGYLEDWLAHPAAGDPYWEPRRAHPDTGAPAALTGAYGQGGGQRAGQLRGAARAKVTRRRAVLRSAGRRAGRSSRSCTAFRVAGHRRRAAGSARISARRPASAALRAGAEDCQVVAGARTMSKVTCDQGCAPRSRPSGAGVWGGW